MLGKKRFTMFSHDAEVGVNVESRMFREPLLEHRMFVRGVVVRDQMQRLVLGRLAVDLAQELQPRRIAYVAAGIDQ